MITPLKYRMCNAVWTFAKNAPDPLSVELTRRILLDAMTENDVASHSVCEDGCNIGFYIASMGNICYLEACAQLGVDFSHRNHQGETALFYLFGSGPMLYLVENSTQPQSCFGFLEKNCSLTDTNTSGQTPIFGLRKMIEQDGMFSNILSQDLRFMPSSEFEYYIWHYEKLLKYAVECGVDISHKDHNGRCFVDPDPTDQSGLNELLPLFFEWRNQIDKIVLTKELSEVEAATSKRRL